MPAPALVTGIFSDTDELCAAVAGMNIEFSQLDRGKLDARLDLAIGQNFVVQHFELGRRFHQRGAAPRGLLTFGLPDHVHKLKWYGRSMERDSILNFSRREGFDAVSDEDFTGYTFSIHPEAFQNALTALDAAQSTEQIRDMGDHFASTNDDIQNIRSLAYGLHYCVKNKTGSPGAYSELEADLAHMLAMRVCDSTDVDTNSNVTQRQLAVDKALELIFSTRDAITVSDVYKYSSVSWRTLDRAFKERFGVTPKQYIVATRMVGVRRALISAPPGTKITGIANDWGFWHLGRFSSDYRSMFGELPSQTLRK